MADETTLDLQHFYKHTDLEIALSAVNALGRQVKAPDGDIKAFVEDRWLALDGMVEQNLERSAVNEAVRQLNGTLAVNNRIMLKPAVDVSDLKTKIEAAFGRVTELNAATVGSSVLGNKVELSGKVRTLAERKEAERAAWSAPVFRELTIIWRLTVTNCCRLSTGRSV